MKEGWNSKSIGEICDVLDKKRKPITKKNRIPGNYPYYGATGILDYVKDFIFDETLVLIGEDGAKWGVGENTAFTAIGKYWVNNHAHVIRPHRDTVLDQWIIYYLNANDLSPFITGLTVPKLNQEKLRGIPIPLPSLSEQKRIVAILDEAFEGIDKTVANAEKNLANARELFESYLNKVFTEKGEGWTETSLAYEVDLLTGYAFKSKEYAESADGIKLLRGDNILQGFFRWEEVKWWPSEKAKEYDKYLLLDGDTVLAMDRTWVKAGIKYAQIAEEELPCLLVQRVARMRCKHELDRNFLYYLIGSKFFESYVLSIQTGSGVPHISGKQIKAFCFHKPPLSIQKTISREINAISSKIKLLESIYQSKLIALTELKQSLLQKAFTGELTANDIAINKEAVA